LSRREREEDVKEETAAPSIIEDRERERGATHRLSERLAIRAIAFSLRNRSAEE